MNRTVASLLWLTLLAACPAAHAVTWHVPSQCPTIQAGIDLATAGDTVLVSPGTYHDCTHFDPHGQLNCVIMKSGVCLRSLTGQADCATIDAEQMGRVICCEDLDATTRIEGFTITGGCAGGTDLPGRGGGIFCRQSSPAVVNCEIVANEAAVDGGGLFMHSSCYPALNNVLLGDNAAGRYGGGLCSATGSSPDMNAVILSGNYSVDSGGGMFVIETSSIALTGCSFLGNVSGGHGGGLFRFGGPTTTLSSCVFAWNYGKVHSGGAHIQNSASCELTNCRFSNNSTEGHGGGMVLSGSQSFMAGCEFVDNQAGGDGGGVYSDTDTDGYYEYCLFAGNSAGGKGGAVAGRYSHSFRTALSFCMFHHNSATNGGAISAQTLFYLLIANCTLSANHASAGGSGLHSRWSDTNCIESIITYGTGGEAVTVIGDCPSMTCCDIYGNMGGDWVGCIAGYCGIYGNYCQCPLYCDPGNDDFHLQECSPCAPGNHPTGYACGLVGAFDVGCDCGLPSRVQPTSWSSLKALYR